MSGRVKLSCALGLAAIVATVVLLRHCSRASDIAQTQADVLELRSAAIRWQIDHGDSACPIIKQLIEGKYLMPHARGVDAWNQPYTISCFQLTIGVTSLGPDGSKGTADDIIAPPAPVR